MLQSLFEIILKELKYMNIFQNELLNINIILKEYFNTINNYKMYYLKENLDFEDSIFVIRRDGIIGCIYTLYEIDKINNYFKFLN